MNKDYLNDSGSNGPGLNGHTDAGLPDGLEKERNRRYVEYKKACLKCRRAAEGKPADAAPDLLSEMKAKREAFIEIDSLLPGNKRIWKNGFREAKGP